MPWTQDTTSGALVHTGTGRDVFLVYGQDGEPAKLGATYGVEIEITEYTHNIKGVVRMAGAGNQGFECGIEGVNVIIRTVDYGDLSAALATAAHGLSSGERATIRIEGTGDQIDCSIIKSTGAVVVVSVTSGTYLNYRRLGIASNVNNAAVTAIRFYERRAVQQTVADVLPFIAAGDLWCAYDDSSAQLIAARVVASDARVSMDVDYEGKVTIVGGGRSRRVDLVARTVSDWTASPGSLPGFTENGTTSAQIVRQFRARTGLAGMENTPFAMAWSAVGEPSNFDYTENTEGRAEFLGVGRNVTVTEPILALHVMSNNVLFIGCTNSVFTLFGDPGDLASDIPPVSTTVGVSGPNAVTSVENGLCAFHAPEGLYSMVQGGAPPVSLSAMVLTEGVQFPRAERDGYTVTIVRDPSRQGLHVFLTRLALAATESTHYWYDEVSGRYEPELGGFFPEKYPVRPTCAAVWRGRPVIGTYEGRIVDFDDTLSQDLGTDVDAYFHLSLINGPDLDQEAELSDLCLTLSNDSEPVSITTYGGASAESVYDNSTRRALHPATDYAKRQSPLGFKVSAPALAVRISGRKFAFEEAQAQVMLNPLVAREPDFWSTPPSPGVTCTPEVPSVPPAPSPTNPSGVGTANPSAGTTGYTSTLRVYVTKGTNPDSTGLGVTINLTSVGGGASQTMYDNGATGGDAVAGDLIFTYRTTVTAAAGTYSLPFTITDAQGRTANGTITVTVTATTPPPPGGGGGGGVAGTEGDSESSIIIINNW